MGTRRLLSGQTYTRIVNIVQPGGAPGSPLPDTGYGYNLDPLQITVWKDGVDDTANWTFSISQPDATNAPWKYLIESYVPDGYDGSLIEIEGYVSFNAQSNYYAGQIDTLEIGPVESVLSASQPNYAPAVAGASVDLTPAALAAIGPVILVSGATGDAASINGLYAISSVTASAATFSNGTTFLIYYRPDNYWFIGGWSYQIASPPWGTQVWSDSGHHNPDITLTLTPLTNAASIGDPLAALTAYGASTFNPATAAVKATDAAGNDVANKTDVHVTVPAPEVTVNPTLTDAEHSRLMAAATEAKQDAAKTELDAILARTGNLTGAPPVLLSYFTSQGVLVLYKNANYNATHTQVITLRDIGGQWGLNAAPITTAGTTITLNIWDKANPDVDIAIIAGVVDSSEQVHFAVTPTNMAALLIGSGQYTYTVRAIYTGGDKWPLGENDCEIHRG